MTFEPSNALHSCLGFFLPNLVAIEHFKAKWLLLDPSWPLHNIWPQQCITHLLGVLPTKFGGYRALLSKLTPTWPQQCITLWSDVLSSKFGCHRAYLSNLTPTWPRLTPTWPLTPAMHYALVRGSSCQIW